MVYSKVSQKEPFDILYITPSLTTIIKPRDPSFSLAPEVAFTGITNLELRLKAAFLAGGEGAESGEEPHDYRLEFWARYYFMVFHQAKRDNLRWHKYLEPLG